ncbi:hypothetical protein Hdeb2414_s0160g00818351 [Helianthus debilis subsp. tardiflorus]
MKIVQLPKPLSSSTRPHLSAPPPCSLVMPLADENRSRDRRPVKILRSICLLGGTPPLDPETDHHHYRHRVVVSDGCRGERKKETDRREREIRRGERKLEREGKPASRHRAPTTTSDDDGAESNVGSRSAATAEVVLNGNCGGVGSVWDFVAGYVRVTLRFTRFRFGSIKVQSTTKVCSTGRLGSTGQPVRVKRLDQKVRFVVRVDSVKPSQLGQLRPGQLSPRFDTRGCFSKLRHGWIRGTIGDMST